MKWVSLFFSLTPCFFHNILTLRLFIYLCMYFSFLVFVLLLHVTIILMIFLIRFIVTPCYCFALVLLLYFAPCPTMLLCLVSILPCYMFCLVIVDPPCYCYSTFVANLLAFLPCHVVAQPCCFSHLFFFFLFASSTNGFT
jgi:hypothetical protein